MLIVNGSLEFVQNGLILSQSGSLTLQADHTHVFDVVVGGANAFRPSGNLTTDLGTDKERWNTGYVGSLISTSLQTATLQVSTLLEVNGASQFNDTVEFAASTNFLGAANFSPSTAFRPNLNGSGLAAVNEMFYSSERCSIADFSAAITAVGLQQNSVSTVTFPSPIAKRSKLRKAFAVSCAHLNGTPPTDWYLVVRKRKAGGTVVDVGSGVFSWATGTFSTKVTARNFTTNPSEEIFEPGDSFSALVHNNGSGTTINTVVAIVDIGFENAVPANGIGI